MLGLALLLAAATVLLAQKFLLSPNNATVTAEVTTIKIVVAKNRLNYGAIINREHLRLISWPKGAAPEGSFNSIADVVRRDEHRVVFRRIEKDEPILKSKISGFGGRASLSTIISKNMRAATIRVNDVNGVAGFILPGDRVDVMITRDPESGTGRRRGPQLATDILLQNVKVLGIDQEADDSKEKPSVAKAVTLEVKPHQAQKLILAQQVGTLSLSLRNVNNSEPAANRTIRVRDLRIGETVKTKSETKRRVRRARRRITTVVKRESSIKIIRGLKSSEYEVPREPRANRPKRTPIVAPSDVPSPRRESIGDKSNSSSPTTPNSGRAGEATAAPGKPVPLYPRLPRGGTGQEASSESNVDANGSIQ